MQLVASLLIALQLLAPCDDSQLYTLKKQTEGDNRFSAFPKIEKKRDYPVYPGGDKALDKLIREKLILTSEAQRYDFILNFYFTIHCDGSIGEVVILGDEETVDWTNISTIIQHTRDWQPAYVNGKAVDCIYFRKLTITRKNS